MFGLSGTRFALALSLLAGGHLLASALTFPQLNEVLKGAGLDRQKGEISEQEIKIVEQISRLYEDNENLSDREGALLENLGTAKPNPQQKNILLAIYNMHLINRAQMNSLSEKLKREVEASIAGESQAAPA